MKRIRILIADDHAPVRAGTRRILEQEDDLEVVAEACDGQEAVTLAISFQPDVAIVDIAMPKLDGIETTRRIKAQCSSIAILILTVIQDKQFITNALEAGASGYLLKKVRSHELIQAVREVYAGYQVIDGSFTWKVLESFRKAE